MITLHFHFSSLAPGGKMRDPGNEVGWPGLWMAARRQVALLWHRPLSADLPWKYTLLALEQLDRHNQMTEVCIKGQVTEQTTVKWSIIFNRNKVIIVIIIIIIIKVPITPKYFFSLK